MSSLDRLQFQTSLEDLVLIQARVTEFMGASLLVSPCEHIFQKSWHTKLFLINWQSKLSEVPNSVLVIVWTVVYILVV